MITLTDSYGGQSANTYVSLEDAESLIEERLDTDEWTGADDEKKKKALLQAARDIDSQNWEGQRYYHHQFLQFPRASDEYDIAEGVLNRAVSEDDSGVLSEHDEYQRQQ